MRRRALRSSCCIAILGVWGLNRGMKRYFAHRNRVLKDRPLIKIFCNLYRYVDNKEGAELIFYRLKIVEEEMGCSFDPPWLRF